MRVLVTGGAGFIGGHVCAALLARGDDVAVIDDLSTGTPLRLPRLTIGDVCDEAALRRVLAGADGVIHLAARSSVPRSMDDPAGALRVNVGGAVSLCAAASATGVRRVVYASSSSVYGDDPVIPRVEDRPLRPLSPYAASKAVAESVFQGFGASLGLAAVGLRFFNVYGPGQRVDGPYAQAVPRFVAAARAGHAAPIFGDGTDTRDYTYVDDVVAGVLRALDRADDVAGRVFNVASGVETSTLVLHRAVADAVGTFVGPTHLPRRPGDQRRSRADTRAATGALGWAPVVGLSEGLRRTVSAQVDVQGVGEALTR